MRKIFSRWLESKADNHDLSDSVDAEKNEVIEISAIKDDIHKQLLEENKDLIKRIRVSSGHTIESAQGLFTTPIENLLKYINDIPAGRMEFSQKGGLFELCLETAYSALIISDTMMFDSELLPKDRKHRKPLWLYASFITGLCYPLGLSTNELIIRTEDKSLEWNPLLEGINEWMEKNQLEDYVVDWNVERSESDIGIYSLAIAKNIIPVSSFKYIKQRDIVAFVLKGISIHDSLQLFAKHPIYEVIHDSYTTSVSRWLKANAKNVLDIEGMSMKHIIVDKLRVLTKEKWSVNEGGKPIWYLKNGVFIWWNKAVRDFRESLDELNLSGIPDDDTLLDIMFEQNILEPYISGGEKKLLWPVQVRHKLMPSGITMMLKVVKPEIVFGQDVIRYFPYKDALISDYVDQNEKSEADEDSMIDTFNGILEDDIPESALSKSNTDKKEPKPNADKKIKQSNENSQLNSSRKNKKNNETNINNQKDESSKEERTGLEHLGQAGELLNSIAKDIRKGKWKSGRDVFWKKDGTGLCLKFPQVMNEYGKEALEQKNTLTNKACLYKSKNEQDYFEELRIKKKDVRFLVVKKHIADVMVKSQSLEISKGYSE